MCWKAAPPCWKSCDKRKHFQKDRLKEKTAPRRAFFVALRGAVLLRCFFCAQTPAGVLFHKLDDHRRQGDKEDDADDAKELSADHGGNKGVKRGKPYGLSHHTGIDELVFNKLYGKIHDKAAHDQHRVNQQHKEHADYAGDQCTHIGDDGADGGQHPHQTAVGDPENGKRKGHQNAKDHRFAAFEKVSMSMKFEEILECSKSNLLEEMRRKDLDAAKKEATRWKEEVQTKVDEQDALKKEMIRVIQGTSGLDREMIQQMVNENKEALLTAQTNLADSEKKLKEIEEQNQKAERNCSDLFTWASTYKGASFERRQAILKQFIKEVRVGRDYNIEIVLNVPLDEFEEFKRHAASAGRGKNQKNKSQNPQKVGRCASNAGIVVLDINSG